MRVPDTGRTHKVSNVPLVLELSAQVPSFTLNFCDDTEPNG